MKREFLSTVYPQLSMHFLPVLCMHCETPSCMEVCPQEAIFKRPDSIVMIDVEKCDGCGVCLSACSYDALLLDEQRDIARKCTLCAHRIDQGLEPFCVTCCSAEAMVFGDLNDADSHISKMIKERQAGFVQPEAKTNPAVYYCPTRFGRIE
jgi:tetrathionate reductase subunit B